ncbi:MAG: beta-galactosidase [Propionibacteriaceae bacterium]|jgi:beta-galactosidase|nr:beta-galactosidase [Propionibacteriaceae bacterium]
MSVFEIGEDAFLVDGQPFRILSGAVHYFRIHPGQWEDRIAKARQFGLNTIDTYVAWNFHSRRPGEFATDGWRDLGRYLDLIQAAGMYAIVRPGPYICAEWANAGLPGWLTMNQGIALRSADPLYLAAVEQYFHSVLPTIAERQIHRGGNVILVQVENEYGAYGSDSAYLRKLTSLIRQEGIEVPLFTCDQANEEMLKRGGLPELLRTGTFGSRSSERLAILRRAQPTGPLLCSEYWNGWFDSWGQHHHTTDAEASAQDLDELLGQGASVNFYPFHGGSNFGFTNGANDKGVYAPVVTSYDYDAPLAEDGTPGPKYAAFRDVLMRHGAVRDLAPARGRRPADKVTVELRRGKRWHDVDWGAARSYDHLPTLDEVDPAAVLAIYETQLAPGDEVLAFADVRDRAQLFLGQIEIGVIDRTRREKAANLPLTGNGGLSIIVEDLGRVDYGSRLGEPKGLIGPARTAKRVIDAWSVTAVDHESIPDLDVTGNGIALDPSGPVQGPVFLWADFEASAGDDLFLDVAQWGRGVAWVNGFCLGRYWSAGPTETLYVPGPVIRAGLNRLLVLELASCAKPQAGFVSGPVLGCVEA